MITLIVGEPGAGKTSLNCYFAIQELVNSHTNFLNSESEISSLRQYGHMPELIDEVCVYSNFKIVNKTRFKFKLRSNVLDPFKMCLPNDEIPFDYYPPCSTFHVMEGQIYWNSRRKGLRDCVCRFFENHRHAHFEIFIDVQRGMLIDANIREIVGNIIEVQKIDVKADKRGVVSQVKWTCREFDSWFSYEQYLNSGKTANVYKQIAYTADFNIFCCYSSYENGPAFYVGCDEKYFVQESWSDDKTLSIVRPLNYYEKRGV